MILLYGAYGYSGKLIVDLAKKQGIPLILAGRSESKIEELAKESGFAFKVLGLDDKEALHAALNDVDVVLHAAGPFRHTARPMVEACLTTKTHYLDITGEIEVFEYCHHMDAKAKEAGIVLLPGSGFDVVPTDCMALYLKNKLPDATHLQLAFFSGGGLSQGTALTMSENLGGGSAVRKDGKIIKTKVGHKTLTAPFHGKPRFCMTIPWGDVSTAYYTTGIPNIETYFAVKPKMHRGLRFQGLFNWVLRTGFVRKQARKRIKSGPAGPDQSSREKAPSLVWGRVKNANGNVVQARLKVPNGYTLTAITALEIAKRIDAGSLKPGFITPAAAFGEDFVLEVPGSEREDL